MDAGSDSSIGQIHTTETFRVYLLAGEVALFCKNAVRAASKEAAVLVTLRKAASAD